jgi:hypothetical protein
MQNVTELRRQGSGWREQQATGVAYGGPEMNTVYRGLNWSTRRILAIFVSLMVLALLAGGTGGYLIRGATTLVERQTISASPAQEKSVTGPLTEPHDGAASRASATGLTEPHDNIAKPASGQGPFTEPHDGGR